MSTRGRRPPLAPPRRSRNNAFGSPPSHPPPSPEPLPLPFDLLDYPIVARPPRLISIAPGSVWVGHIPFAMALVQMLRPRHLVELGTHAGDSYCAFCEAVLTLGVDGRCTAVDTWTGDRHSGAYGPEVLANLRAVHDPAYGGFSRLLQAPFADAVGQFADGSVDLLHIDGLHTYEAVRDDFESWLPKMSDRGVVLFHDTAERGGDFGVWRLWDEVTPGRRHFDFHHASGLGVLGVGPSLPAPVVEFFDAADAKPDAVRAVFAKLAGGLQMMQLARSTVVPLIQLQGGVNEWGNRTGRPANPPGVDVNAAFGEPVRFATRLSEQVRFALAEDLTLRKL